MKAIFLSCVVGFSFVCRASQATTCEQWIEAAVMREAQRIDPGGHLQIVSEAHFGEGLLRFDVNDGFNSIQVDVTVDRSCRVVSVSGNSDRNDANGS